MAPTLLHQAHDFGLAGLTDGDSHAEVPRKRWNAAANTWPPVAAEAYDCQRDEVQAPSATPQEAELGVEVSCADDVSLTVSLKLQRPPLVLGSRRGA